jgi:hypothetical protein
MKKNIFSIAIACLAVGTASAQENGAFAPVAGADSQTTSGQTQVRAGAQANVSQQTSTPLILNVAGATVKDESGQQVGQIQNLLVSPQGCVDMAVLSLGGTKLVPVPWQLVSVSSPSSITPGAPARTTLALNVDRQKLQQAPSFSMNQISQITQPQTIQQVFNFYGVQPNQTAGVGATASQSSSISGGTSSTNGTQGSSQTTTRGGTNQFGTSTGATNTNQFGTSAATASTNQFGSRSTNQFGAQATATNQFGAQATATNQFGSQSATNRQEMLSPTGRTNGYPGRPGFTNTNPPAGRPPFNRPPDNRPPTNTPPPRPGQ